MKYEIIYIPKIQDEVSVAQFNTQLEAEKWMEHIKNNNPKSYPHHYIKGIEND